MVTTTSDVSTSAEANLFGNSWETSSPSSAIASTTAGLTRSAGAVPADSTRTRPDARWSSSAAAIWERPALCTQTNRTVGTSDIGELRGVRWRGREEVAEQPAGEKRAEGTSGQLGRHEDR